MLRFLARQLQPQCLPLAHRQIKIGPGTTLQSGYYWVRAVTEPNFHKYLQTTPEYSPGVAVLNAYTTAGQFQVVDGQLVQLVSGTGTPPSFLYGNVGQEKTRGGSQFISSHTLHLIADIEQKLWL